MVLLYLTYSVYLFSIKITLLTCNLEVSDDRLVSITQALLKEADSRSLLADLRGSFSPDLSGSC